MGCLAHKLLKERQKKTRPLPARLQAATARLAKTKATQEKVDAKVAGLEEQLAQARKEQEENAAKVAEAEAEFRAVQELAAVGTTASMASHLLGILASTIAGCNLDPAVVEGIMRQILQQCNVAGEAAPPPAAAGPCDRGGSTDPCHRGGAGRSGDDCDRGPAAATAAEATHHQAAAAEAATKAAETASDAAAAAQHQAAVEAAAGRETGGAVASSVAAAARNWPPERPAPSTHVGGLLAQLMQPGEAAMGNSRDRSQGSPRPAGRPDIGC